MTIQQRSKCGHSEDSVPGRQQTLIRHSVTTVVKTVSTMLLLSLHSQTLITISLHLHRHRHPATQLATFIQQCHLLISSSTCVHRASNRAILSIFAFSTEFTCSFLVRDPGSWRSLEVCRARVAESLLVSETGVVSSSGLLWNACCQRCVCRTPFESVTSGLELLQASCVTVRDLVTAFYVKCGRVDMHIFHYFLSEFCSNLDM